MSIITLLTDFGVSDEYAGVLKGVIYRINPQAKIVDLSHGIDPQDVVQAAFTLKAAFHFFPAGTIHTVIVDPGVGSERAIMAARFNGHLFLAPDNGLLSTLWEESIPDVLVRVENSSLFLKPVSRTFHGRDIFAPVAAHLSVGKSLNELGPILDSDKIVRLPSLLSQQFSDGSIAGRIIGIDRFGNLITNISQTQIKRLKEMSKSTRIRIRFGGYTLEGLSSSYVEVPPGRPLAIIGSRNYLEIAVNRGNAARLLEVSSRGRNGLTW